MTWEVPSLFFSPQEGSLEQVVIVNMEMIGFITQEESRLPESFRKPESVLVYIPMSYMIGGFTLLIPRGEVTPCKMNTVEVMRFVLTAGIAGKNTS